MYIRVLVQRKQRNDLVIDIDNVIGRLWEGAAAGREKLYNLYRKLDTLLYRFSLR